MSKSYDMKVGVFGQGKGKKDVFMDPEYLTKLGIEEGDIVEVRNGNKKLAARAITSKPDEYTKDHVRISNDMWKSLGIDPEENVSVGKLEYDFAQEITFKETNGKKLSDSEKRAIQTFFVDNPYEVGEKFKINSGTSYYEFEVSNYSPRMEAAMVSSATKIRIKKHNPGVEDVEYADVGGLGKQVDKIREMIELPLKSPEAFEKLGIKAPKGVILYGPPGCGKTLMGKAVANETDANFIYFSGAAVHGSLYGSSEQKVRELFEEAQKKAPCILFIDEIDAMAPKRDEMGGNQEVEKRVVSQLLTAMDGLKGRGDVVVIGATNRPDSLDEALRRPGRFDREIEIPIPNTQGRKEIFDIQTKTMPLDKDVNLEELSRITHGYSGADIHGLCKEAAMKVLKRYTNEILENGSGILDGKKISMNEFMEAYTEITPSGLRELYIEVPDVKWDDVGGLSQAKQELLEAVEWPLNHKKLMEKASKRQQKGILLEGPPGCGKTLLAKAIANKTDVNFISVTGADIMNKYVGESQKNVQKIFKKARMYSPCILFFDEIETLAPERGKYDDTSGASKDVVGQFLAEIDGVEGLEDVVILAATNKPEMIDKALMRPGRFDKKIHIGEPSESDRLEIYKIHTKDKPMAPDINLNDYTNVEGLTGAEIELICEEASKMAMRDFVKKFGDKESEKRADEFIIEKKYFDDAIRAVKPDAKRRNNNQMDSDIG